MNDYEQYDSEVNSDRNCYVYQRTRVRWNEDGTATAFVWLRNPETMESYGWRRFDVARVTVDMVRPGLVTAGKDFFAPAGRTVRCAAVVVRPWGRDELEVQGVAERHLAQDVVSQ